MNIYLEWELQGFKGVVRKKSRFLPPVHLQIPMSITLLGAYWYELIALAGERKKILFMQKYP